MKPAIAIILLMLIIVKVNAQISPALYGTWESIPIKQEKGAIPQVQYTYAFNSSDTVIFRSYIPNVKYHLKLVYATTPVGPNEILLRHVKTFQVEKKAEVDISEEVLFKDPKKLSISKVVGETIYVAIDYFDGKPLHEFGLRPAKR